MSQVQVNLESYPIEFNTSQICTITVHIKKQNTHIQYKPGYRPKNPFKYIWTIREGYFDIFDRKFDQESLIKELQITHSYIEDYKVFYWPHVVIRMSNQQVLEKFFLTEKETIDYVNQIKYHSSKDFYSKL